MKNLRETKRDWAKVTQLLYLEESELWNSTLPVYNTINHTMMFITQ